MHIFKKVLIAGVGIVAMLSLTIPAQATSTLHAKNCVTKISPNNTKAIEICTWVVSWDNGDVNVKVQIDKVAGYQQPDNVDMGGQEWSNSAFHPTLCDGRSPNCIGGGDFAGVGWTNAFDSLPFAVSSDRLDCSHHYYESHSEASGSVGWTSGTSRSDYDFNSGLWDQTTDGCG